MHKNLETGNLAVLGVFIEVRQRAERKSGVVHVWGGVAGQAGHGRLPCCTTDCSWSVATISRTAWLPLVGCCCTLLRRLLSRRYCASTVAHSLCLPPPVQAGEGWMPHPVIAEAMRSAPRAAGVETPLQRAISLRTLLPNAREADGRRPYVNYRCA